MMSNGAPALETGNPVADRAFLTTLKMRSSRVLLFLPPLLCGLLAACDNNPHPKPLHEKRADGSPWVVAYRALPDDPRSLDPQFTYDTLSHLVVAQIYEGLLEYQPFKTDPYELTPCLAEKMPERIRNADGTESYIFKIKRGVFFHDSPCFAATGGKGRELVADDFVYTLKRIADPKVECPILSTLQDYFPGLKDAYDGARKTGKYDYSQPLNAAEAIDDHTVRLNLLKPYPQIQYWLAMPFLAPVPHEAVEYFDGKKHDDEARTRDQFKFHPVGTGAFRFVEWGRSRMIRLARHERYSATRFPASGWKPGDDARFRPLAGAAIPFVDEVQMPIVREIIPAWLLFRQGYLDRSIVSKDVFGTVMTSGQELTGKYRARGVQLQRDVEPGTFYAVFNMDDPVVGKNRKLREAISTAYDEDLGNQIFFNGVDINAQQLLPPGVAGHDADFKNPYKQHDLPLAKKLLGEAGYPDGVDAKTGQSLELTIDMTANDSQTRQMAEFEKGQIEQLGIRVKIQENTWSSLQDKMHRGNFQIYSGSGWFADYPDPENFFFLFYSRNAPPEGNNYGHYANPEFDRLFEQMGTMDNGPARLEIIRRMNGMLVEDCPIVLMSHRVLLSLSQPWSPRVVQNQLAVGSVKYSQIDTALRAEKIREWNRKTWWPMWVVAVLAAGAAGYAVWWGRKRNV